MKTYLLLLLASVAVAQTAVYPIPCNRPVQKTIVFPVATVSSDGGVDNDGGYVFLPNVALAARKSITLCNSRKNAGSPIWTLNWDADGGVPTTAAGSAMSNGLSLAVGDCVFLSLPSGTKVRGICDVLDSGIEITECR